MDRMFPGEADLVLERTGLPGGGGGGAKKPLRLQIKPILETLIKANIFAISSDTLLLLFSIGQR